MAALNNVESGTGDIGGQCEEKLETSYPFTLIKHDYKLGTDKPVTEFC